MNRKRLIVAGVVEYLCCAYVVYFALSTTTVVASASYTTSLQQIELMELEHLLDSFDLSCSLLWISCTTSCTTNPQQLKVVDLQHILQLSYDKVTIDLRRTSNLQNILRRTQGFS